MNRLSRLLSKPVMMHAILQVAEANMHLFAQFLNNSSSRWEAICENWQVMAELVDSVSPIYRSDFQRSVPQCTTRS